MEEVYRLREFRPPDFVQQSRLWSQNDPTWSVSPEEMERREGIFLGPPMIHRKLVAELRATGTAVGFGILATDAEMFDPQVFWFHVAVDRMHQSRGIGRALADALLSEADRFHAIRLLNEVMEDDVRGARFQQRLGFVERSRAWRSRLLVADASTLANRTSQLSQSGISFVTAAELDLSDPQIVRQLYELDASVSADEPRLGKFTPVTVEQFTAAQLQGPGFLPEAYFLARADGRFVAESVLRRLSSEPAVLGQAFTGTLREYRGRGIASELKRRGVEFAHQHGYRSIVTGNDSLNEPMLAINRKLGYRPERVRITGERILTKLPSRSA